MLNIFHLTKTYGNKKAVDDLSLRIEAGEICGFIGHNGAGKTTTLKSIAGLLRFDSGDITVGGKSVKTDAMDVKKQIAYVPDNPDLYEFMPAVKFLGFIADAFGIPSAKRNTEIEKYADLFELTEDLAQPISAFSHGMKQKLALIAALLHDPKLILLDEPFVGLDPKASFAVKQIMREKCGEGSAVFFSTHVLETAEKLCDNVAIISHGKLAAFGTMDSVRGDKSLESVFFELEKAAL